MESRRKSFVDAMVRGQERLAPSAGLEAVAAVLQDFGRALAEFTDGRVGVACVTRDGHVPIGGEFVPDVDMSIVLVPGTAPGTQMPIVASLRIASGGFPVRFGLPGSSEVDVANAGGLAHMLDMLGGSNVFSTALKALMEGGASLGTHSS